MLVTLKPKFIFYVWLVQKYVVLFFGVYFYSFKRRSQPKLLLDVGDPNDFAGCSGDLDFPKWNF